MNKFILDEIKNLNISEGCLLSILERINIEVQSNAAKNSLSARTKKVHDLLNSVKLAKSRDERRDIIKNIGLAQKRVKDAESKIIHPDKISNNQYEFKSDILK